MNILKQYRLWKAMKRYSKDWETIEKYGVKTVEFINGILDGQYMEAPGNLEEHSITHRGHRVDYSIRKREDGKVVAELKENGG